MYWIIWAGNTGQFPYYIGARRPLSCCAEDAKWFYTSADAAAYISDNQLPTWLGGSPAQPVPVEGRVIRQPDPNPATVADR